MWQQRASYEQSNVVDVTIQCQFNVSAKNVAEFTTMYGGPAAGSQQTASRHHTGSFYQPSSDTNASPPPGYCHFTSPDNCYYENAAKRGFQCDHDVSSGHYLSSYNGYNAPRMFLDSDNSDVKYGYISDSVNSYGNVSENNGHQYYMNDSGYGSPSTTFNQQRGSGSAFSPCSQSVSPSRTLHGESSPVYGQCESLNRTVRDDSQSAQLSPVSRSTAPEEPTEEMKIAMREKDVLQRLFSLRTAGVDGASGVEQYYQSQSTVIDIERHNVLCQMAYDRKSSDSIQKYYHRKLLSLLECIEEKLCGLEDKRHKNGKRQVQHVGIGAEKKSRLLPKHAIKVMESWYKENLENPYPSRETTLSMAAEGGITVEQIRKWFANKRNRSRNGKLKASDAD